MERRLSRHGSKAAYFGVGSRNGLAAIQGFDELQFMKGDTACTAGERLENEPKATHLRRTAFVEQ
jgi:hypothetical protein